MKRIPLFVATLLACAVAVAAPLVPASDAEVVETLPAATASRAEDRQLRRWLAERPDDAALAATVARRHLQRARDEGDPRHAGLALAALQRWPDAATAPPEVLLLQATLQQHLHRFETAAAMLETLLGRAPRDAQAWLTLATLRRVQGRYAASDAACRGVAAGGAALHAAACLAENQALRGDFAPARTSLQRLADTPAIDAGTRGWLLTTLAELEERAGRAPEAERAWQAALRADAGDSYTRIAFADLLIRRGRGAEALAQLERLPRNDAVLLRRAIAARRIGPAAGADDARDLRERIALANQRPDTPSVHGREQAMFALWVDDAPQRALALARLNLRAQREPIDLLLLAQAARAAGDRDALREAETLRRELGLVDRRVDALL